MYKNDLHIGEFYDYDCVNNLLITFLSFEILLEHYAKAATETYYRNICLRGVPSWKMPICSRLKGLLKNNYVFED